MINKFNKCIPIIIVFIITIMTIGYSVLNKELNISGEVNYRPQGDMRITNVKQEDINNATIEYFDFSRKEIKLAYSSSGSAFLKFTVEVTNYSNTEMGILNIDGLDGGIVEGYTLGTKLVGEDNNSKAGMTKEFTITYNSSEVETKSLLLKFDFEEVFTITYKNIVGNYQKEILNSDNLNITLLNPPKDLVITMNGVNIDTYIYDYVTGKLSINNVTGNLVIEPSIPNEPVLSDGMIPVYYDENNKVWKKADAKNENNNWYNYDNQMWANAVTVTATNRSTYVNGNVGITIPMEDINTMWVWIPRYSYTIKSEDGKDYFGKKETGRIDMPTKQLPGEIDVKFIRVNDKDTGNAQYTGDIVNEYFTPPGFTFGTKELSGVWFGKFEAGSINGTIPGDVETDNLLAIRPDIKCWRGIRVSTLELISTGITKPSNIYGFGNNIFDAHATKDSEYALASYITQSKYGKYGNSLYTGENKEVYINSYNGYVTGCSSGTPFAPTSTTCNYKYNDLTNKGPGTGYAGAGASTTGNVYGIYDINGGAFEYAMGVLTLNGIRYSGNSLSYNSGYTGQTMLDNSIFNGRNWLDDKYYDFYISSDPMTACGGKPCKGYSMGETAAWYDDHTGLPRDTYSTWSLRSCYFAREKNGGIFSYDENGGAAGEYLTTFRVILTPQ